MVAFWKKLMKLNSYHVKTISLYVTKKILVTFENAHDLFANTIRIKRVAWLLRYPYSRIVNESIILIRSSVRQVIQESNFHYFNDKITIVPVTFFGCIQDDPHWSVWQHFWTEGHSKSCVHKLPHSKSLSSTLMGHWPVFWIFSDAGQQTP